MKIKGKTKKAKDRIHNHGNEWKEPDFVGKYPYKSPGSLKDIVLLQSVKDGYLAWFHKEDFEVIND